ncbi:hypothetical protein ABHZ06_09965, partial [Bacteroides humanifaecis]
FLTDIFILSAEKQPIKLSWRKIEWLQYNGGSIELADLLCIHHVENFGEKNTKDFTTMVPVKVTYTWGTVSAKVAIAVDGTIANR